MNKVLKYTLAKYPILYRIGSYIKYFNNILNSWNLIKELGKLYNLEGYKDKRVIFNLVRAESFHPLLFESTLAVKLSSMGVDAKVLYDDGMLRHHDTIGIEDAITQKDMLLKSKVRGLLLDNFPFYLKYSKIITKQEIKSIPMIASGMLKSNNFIYKGIDLEPYIMSSAVRFFKSAMGVIEDEPNYKGVVKNCTENALISVLVASKVFKKIDPDIIVTSHGIYTTWGPFYEYFKMKGKKVITYDFGGYRNNGVLFSKNGLVPNRHDDGFFKYWINHYDVDYSLIEKKINSLMKKRFNNSFPDQSSFILSSDLDKIPSSLKTALKNNKEVFALFPNVLWDASLTGVDSIFRTPMQWIIETIRFFESQEDKVLIVRAHPSESTLMRTSKGVKFAIEKLMGKDVNNIKNLIFIDSDCPLSSYLLFPYIKAGIVYNGTIGLEMMYKNIPVLIAGKSPYSRKGFTIDFDSKEEYFKYMDRIDEILIYQQNNRNSLIRFLYFYFVMNEIPISFFDKKGIFKDNLSLKDIIDDENLTYIAETIIDKHTFFQEWYFNRKRGYKKFNGKK